jgi:hypothetical protein
MSHKDIVILWRMPKCATELKFSGVKTVTHLESITESKYSAPLTTCLPITVQAKLWASMCYECATCIIWGPKATIYSTGIGANMQEAP